MLRSGWGAVNEVENFEHRALTSRNICVYSATSLLTSIRRGDGKEDAAKEDRLDPESQPFLIPPHCLVPPR